MRIEYESTVQINSNHPTLTVSGWTSSVGWRRRCRTVEWFH